MGNIRDPGRAGADAVRLFRMGPAANCRRVPPQLLTHIMGEAELNSLFPGGRHEKKRYLAVWAQWTYFAHMKGQPKWLTKTGMGWGEP